MLFGVAKFLDLRYNKCKYFEGSALRFMKIFKRSVASACIYFTAISVFLLAVQLIFGEQTDTTTVTPFRFILILPYSFVISLANIFYKSEASYPFARVICHYLAVVVGFFLFMYLPTVTDVIGSTSLVVLFLTTVLYVFAYVIVKLIGSAIKTKENNNKKYNSMFKKN